MSSSALFKSARWYDLGVNWDARLKRELPVLCEIFGPPGELGLLDAACGTGRHLVALADLGYWVAGLDVSADMLVAARAHLTERGLEARLVETSLEATPPAIGPFDGVFCVGNSLAAMGYATAAQAAMASMARALRPGGRLFVQIVNFVKMRAERPCIRGPRARVEEGIEYLTTRVFSFHGDAVDITSLTLWNDQGWQHFAASSTLYPISQPEILDWATAGGLTVDALYGGYDRQPFDVASSEDLILVATKW
jgi:glycine/sarcosine N-methyltransferase